MLLIIPSAIAQPVFRANVNLIPLSVRVADKRNREVSGLSVSNFTLLENGLRQKIALFVPEQQPVTLGILLDTSSSMAGQKIAQAKSALRALIAAGNPQNEIFYMEFADQAGDIVELSPSSPRLPEVIAHSAVQRGGTSLYDAAAVALCRLRNAHNPRQALLIITDGADQDSRIHLNELLRIVQSSPAQVFVIGYFSDYEHTIFSTSDNTLQLISGSSIDNPLVVFNRLAHESGAEGFFPRTQGDLNRAMEAVSNALQTQYTLGYYAEPSSQPVRRLEVKVDRGGVNITYRRVFNTEDALAPLFLENVCRISPEQHPYAFEQNLKRETGHLIYHDDFTNPASGWPDNNDKSAAGPGLGSGLTIAHRGYSKDGYELRRLRPRKPGEHSVNAEATLAAYGPWLSDFRATVQFEHRPTSAAGIVFRMNDLGFYAFLVSGEFFKVVRREYDQPGTVNLNMWEKAMRPKVAHGDDRLKIAVECRGDRFSFFIDGVQVKSLEDNHMDFGLAGMALYGTGHAIFRDLLVEEFH